MRKKKKILWKRRYSELAPIQMCIINGNKPKPGCILVTSQKSKEKILNIFREKKLVWIKKWESQWHQISHSNTKSGEIFSKIWGNDFQSTNLYPTKLSSEKTKETFLRYGKKLRKFSSTLFQKMYSRKIRPRQRGI